MLINLISTTLIGDCGFYRHFTVASNQPAYIIFEIAQSFQSSGNPNAPYTGSISGEVS